VPVRDLFDLAIPGLAPLPFLSHAPDKWRAMHDRLHQTVFLRSEGLTIEMGAPQQASGALLETCREVSARFARFYAYAARAYFDRPELRPEFLLEPLVQPLVELDAESRTTTPLARLDCVLDTAGHVNVVEINSIGGNLYHMRGLLYLIRGLHRAGMFEGAEAVDQITRQTVDGFERHYRLHQPHPVARPTLGVLSTRSWLRAANPLLRAAFERMGWNYVYADPDAISIDARGVHAHGTKIDLLWHDFLFQIAYQTARYQQTKWPSRIVDYSGAPAQTTAILTNPLFLDHVRNGRVVGISSGLAYLGLSKSLLAWIHDPERPCPPEDRAWLADHTARTFSRRDRLRGVLTIEQAMDERDGLLVKPCQYGGSHGVCVGRDTAADTWSETLRRIWDEDSWVVQRFHEPIRARDGQWVSLGLQAFEGVLGAIYMRLSPTTIISARDAALIPVVVPRQ
jgi:hypothetical protein